MWWGWEWLVVGVVGGGVVVWFVVALLEYEDERSDDSRDEHMW
jgi:type VI protein secretion system component VasK